MFQITLIREKNRINMKDASLHLPNKFKITFLKDQNHSVPIKKSEQSRFK